MKFSEQWLREWVNPSIDAAELCHQLTMTGLEVDGREPVAADFTQVVVGKILQAEQHPDADKLRVCQVDVAADEPLQIVCGAANARAGISVCVATVGACLPGGFKIKKAKLRGVASHGMLCSASELGMSEQSSGIMELPADLPLGQDVRVALQLDDQTIEIDLTANRGDCFSLRGIAREIATLHQLSIHEPEIETAAVVHAEKMVVQVNAPEACPRYACRLLRRINPAATTPLWLQERLRRCGVRPISPVVDVTNYVMLALGQPMHAFDAEKISGAVTVRYSQADESLTLLDGQTVTCVPETLSIADDRGPIALAGIMGGEHTAVTDQTTDILLESAFFAPLAVMGKPRQYGLHTDASVRFERGVDPSITLQALDYATMLLQDIVGGEAGEMVVAEAAAHLPKAHPIALTFGQLHAYLGIPIAADEVKAILQRLGFECVREQVDTLEAIPPAHRFDMQQPVDLIEEIARIYGYHNIPSCLPITTLQPESVAEYQVTESRLRHLLADKGYWEAMTYSFIDPVWHETFFPELSAKALLNPIASDMAVMRTSLLPGLVKAAQHNLNHQQRQLRLFELGTCFVPEETDYAEVATIALLQTGVRDDSPLHNQDAKVDFYDLKAELVAMWALSLRPALDWQLVTTDLPHYLHPGRSARIIVDQTCVGVMGQLHPSVAKKLDIRQPVWLLELDLPTVLAGKLPKAQAISKYPAVRRDLAVEVDAVCPVADLEGVVRQSAGEYLQQVSVFDVYQGEPLAADKKSVALNLIFQSLSDTLEEDLVQSAVEKILAALHAETGATLRT